MQPNVSAHLVDGGRVVDALTGARHSHTVDPSSRQVSKSDLGNVGDGDDGGVEGEGDDFSEAFAFNHIRCGCLEISPSSKGQPKGRFL